MTELLSAFNKQTKQRWGVHEVLALIFQDNKQRFLVAGSEDDPRAVYPLWVRAAHGHSVNLDLDDRDIAVRWFTLVPRDQGPLAPYKGRPCAAIEDVPPRLYHRTVEDAAFQILDGELTPGFGDSGKIHNYFSSLPLEEMTNQAGVRKDLPIEIVFETTAVLRYAYLFETASDGVLCREKVPGSTILYIRNSAKDEILYSRPVETPASDTAAPMDDSSPTQVVAVTQSASASTDLAVIPEEPRPRTATTHLEFPCPKCQNSCRVGQFYCGTCTEPLRDLAHSNVRRTVQMARLRAVNEICARSGMAPSNITVEHIRGSQGSDISQRGLLSLDAESTQTAKKQVKSALKLGFKSVLDRFINDVGFALRSTERGLTQSAMRVQDATAVLPNPGRSSEQRTMGVGAQGSMQYNAGANATSTARFPLPARRPSGASQSKSDYVSKLPLHGSVLAWSSILLGRVCQPAVRHWPGEQDHLASLPLHGTLRLRLLRRPGSQHFSTCPTLWTPILLLLSVLHQSRRRTRDVLSRSNQSTASPTRPKAVGKGGVVAQQLALAPRKRRPKERATQPMARTDAAVPRTGEDAGTGTTPATAGLSSDNA